MNEVQVKEKVQELMKDSQFKAKFEEAKDLDAVAVLFQNEGIQISGADLEAAFAMKENGEELSEQNLDNVSGGITVGAAIGLACLVIGGITTIEGYYDAVKKKAKACFK